MPQNTIKVATLTAHYNNGKYFHELILSLLGQTRVPDFMVIVDDKSLDDSIEIILEYLNKNSKDVIKVENNYVCHIEKVPIYLFLKDKNSGPAATRNVGLKFLMDKTDAIFIADSDDIYYPKKIEQSLRVMAKHWHVGLVYSDYDTLDIKTGIIKREYKEIFNYDRLVEECIVSNNSAISTNILKKVGLYDESLFGPEDYDLWLRLAEVAGVYHIPESLYQYRLSGDNLTQSTSSEKLSQHVMRVHQKVIERQRQKYAKQS